MIDKINEIIKHLEYLKDDLDPEINKFNSKGLTLISKNLNTIRTAITLVSHSGYRLSIKERD